MFFEKLKPEAVFTPRSADVNPDMYVTRPDLELALKKGLRGNLHLLIHGESGSGKSWLYKKTLGDEKGEFLVANLANASRLGSISAELQNLIDREGAPKKTSYDEEKSAEVDAAIARGSLSYTGSYQIGQREPFEECLAFLRKKAGRRSAVLVFDNLEAAFSEPLLKELADLLILCDDSRYSMYAVKVLIVGVPSGVKEYFYKTPHHSTVANRLHELPEVSRLTKTECESLVKRGFLDKLKYAINDLDPVIRHVTWLSDRVPQVVHEYCLELAFLGEAERRISEADLSRADAAWLSQSLYHAYSVVESHMNERDTKAGRRNQTLFALAQSEGEQFKSSEVETLIRQEFPSSTTGTALNAAQMLSTLSGTDKPLVRRSPKGDAFTFCDPRYRMALRAMLAKTTDERVERMPIAGRA